MANKRYQRMAPYRRKEGAITARHIAIGKSRFKICSIWKLCNFLILHNFLIFRSKGLREAEVCAMCCVSFALPSRAAHGVHQVFVAKCQTEQMIFMHCLYIGTRDSILLQMTKQLSKWDPRRPWGALKDHSGLFATCAPTCLFADDEITESPPW